MLGRTAEPCVPLAGVSALQVSNTENSSQSKARYGKPRLHFPMNQAHEKCKRMQDIDSKSCCGLSDAKHWMRNIYLYRIRMVLCSGVAQAPKICPKIFGPPHTSQDSLIPQSSPWYPISQIQKASSPGPVQMPCWLHQFGHFPWATRVSWSNRSSPIPHRYPALRLFPGAIFGGRNIIWPVTPAYA